MFDVPKLLKQTGAAGAVAGQAFSSASTMTALLGLLYLVDCRITAGWNNAQANNCYLTGFPLMGIGVAGRGGFQVGYRTYNPQLRDPRNDSDPPPNPAVAVPPKEKIEQPPKLKRPDFDAADEAIKRLQNHIDSIGGVR